VMPARLLVIEELSTLHRWFDGFAGRHAGSCIGARRL